MSSSTPMPTTYSFEQFVKGHRALIEESLETYLSNGDPNLLYQAMNYSVVSGGKRLRALLCLAGAQTIATISCDFDDKQLEAREQIIESVMPTACAVEMIHAMSLIHDDLPALDNDDLRRGQPTNHKVFGEAIALLAGDALLMQAVETILTHTPAHIDPRILVDVARGLTAATGPRGMVGGQVFDLIYTGELNLPESVSKEMLDKCKSDGIDLATLNMVGKCDKSITPETVHLIHSKKTGALIRYALWSGAKLALASENQLDGIHKFGELLGLAFQIADDLLDITGDKETLGKTPGKDAASDKATWIKVFGVEGAKRQLEDIKVEGRDILTKYNLESDHFPVLSELLEFAIVRTN